MVIDPIESVRLLSDRSVYYPMMRLSEIKDEGTVLVYLQTFITILFELLLDFHWVILQVVAGGGGFFPIRIQIPTNIGGDISVIFELFPPRFGG